MTGNDVFELRTSMHLNPEEFATLVGVAYRTVYRWELYRVARVPPMVEATRRVFLVLQSSTRLERAKWAGLLKDHGWRAAWAQMFNMASGAKPPVKTTTSKTRTR